MLKEIALIVIVAAAGAVVSRLWSRHKFASALTCVLVALVVVWLARHWQIDLRGVS